MKLTLEQHGDKISIETKGDYHTAIEVVDYVCQIMMCAGYHYESVKKAIYEKSEGYECEDKHLEDSTSELKQDKERLDWLLKNCLIKELDLEWVHDSRETIDEAMEAECSDETNKSQSIAN